MQIHFQTASRRDNVGSFATCDFSLWGIVEPRLETRPHLDLDLAVAVPALLLCRTVELAAILTGRHTAFRGARPQVAILLAVV